MPNKEDKERRREPRFAKRLTGQLKAPNGVEQACVTKDISAGGVFLYCQTEIAAETPIDLVIILPPEIAGEKQWVCCRAKVIRVEGDMTVAGQHGVAAQIESLEFLPEITA